MKKLLSVLVLGLALAACSPAPQKPEYHGQVKSYKTQHRRDDGSIEWIYWYLLYTNMGSSSSTYYYSSPTPISNYSDINFTKAATLPPEAKEAVEHGELIEAQEIAQEQLPAEVEQAVETEMTTQEAAFESYAEHESAMDSGDIGGDSGGDFGGGDFGGGFE
jgi:hypothetical protein